MGDMHVCPLVNVLVPHVGGPIISGSFTVLIGGMPAARVTDMCVCAGPPDMIVMGAFTVLIGGLPAARMTDMTAHGGMIVLGSFTVLIGAPGAGATAPFESAELAASLIDVGGSADGADAALVVQELMKFPPGILKTMKKNGTRVVACRNSITDYRTDLKGVHPRGWPPGATWDSVPGVYLPDHNQVVIAVVGHGTAAGAHVPKTGEGHGSRNVVLHESAHSIDRNSNPQRSASPEYNRAMTADAATLSPYESQPGVAGQEESYAESAARYYDGDATDATKHPNLNNYWKGDPVR
jgi:uncharacterized Zn-binding protein involved in type VI secretion